MSNCLVVLWNWNFLIIYFKWILFRIPPELLVIHLLVVSLGMILIYYYTHEYNKRLMYNLWLLLFGYLSLVLCSTLILRDTFEEYRYELVPFWSYYAYLHRDSQLLTQIYLNVLLFVPIGLLLGILNHKGIVKVLLCGMAISLFIESCQLLFKKGIFEFDDIFHNVIGCIIGYLSYKVTKLIFQNIRLLCQYLKTKPC